MRLLGVFGVLHPCRFQFVYEFITRRQNQFTLLLESNGLYGGKLDQILWLHDLDVAVGLGLEHDMTMSQCTGGTRVEKSTGACYHGRCGVPG